MASDEPLTSGTRLGPYSIVECIGAGGMGDVYRARDSKLGRDVAIKVVRRAFVDDPLRASRMEREARILASLNHPHIAVIHGFEDSSGIPAVVMELVEGPTLAERLAEGPTPVSEALAIAGQIADALEYAHERGIVHRDLKPANVKIGGGTVKLLDFGLAKALDVDVAAAAEGATATQTMNTAPGVILGTAAYMAPEQATGRPVDRRTDIWAFGCVLYEMLTGKAAFGRDSMAETLAAAIRAEPDWTALPPATPPGVVAVLRRCLQKDVRQRWHAIGDVRLALLDAANEGASIKPAVPPAPRRAVPLAALLLVAACAAGTAAYVTWRFKTAPEVQQRVVRFTITLPPGRELTAGAMNLALSRDGDQLAYVAAQGNSRQIYLYTMSTGDTRPVPGTAGASSPFFSPDGKWVAFAAEGKLRKASLTGTVVQDLADVSTYFFGGSWSPDRTIVFAPYSSALERIPDSGGTPVALTRFSTGETLHAWPEFLPDGRAVLFAAVSDAPMSIAAVTGTGNRRELIRGRDANMPRYAGLHHVVYLQHGNLMALPFDAERLEAGSDAVPVTVVPDVDSYSVSPSGSLAYVASNDAPAAETLVWVGRDGREGPVGLPERRVFNQPRLSPDGRHVVVDVVDDVEAMQVWKYDLATSTFRPFTVEGTANRHAIWTSDSKQIAFMSNRAGATQIFSQSADGGGGARQLTDNPATPAADILTIPYGFSRDGRLLTYVTVSPTGPDSYWLLHVDTRQSEALPIRASSDGAPQLSPDGRWLAYVADDPHHQRQVFVRALSGPGGPWAISTDGGTEPQWRADGRELFFRNGDAMLAVATGTDGGFAPGKPQVLFRGPYAMTGGGYTRADYDVSADGQRFLMLKAAGPKRPVTEVHVVLNWTGELNRIAPAR